MLIELKHMTHQDGDFVIAKAYIHDNGSTTFSPVKGNLPQAQPGKWYEADGKLETHPRYGDQWNLSNAREVMPRDERGVLNWLVDKGFPYKVASHLVNTHGIEQVKDKMFSEEAVANCGLSIQEARELIEKLSSADSILLAVPGLGAKKVAELNKWAREQAIDLKAMLDENPYQLLEAPGVGWTIADAVARQMGIANDDPRRLAAAPYQVLVKNEGDGHTWMGKNDMLSKASKMLSMPSHRVIDAIMQPQTYSPIVLMDDKVFRAETLRNERGFADGVRRLREAPSRIFRYTDAMYQEYEYPCQNTIEDVFETAPFPLTDEQKEAIQFCLSNKVTILTGGPGTGKSSITRLVVDALDKANVTGIVLCSPTGKAARRLAEVTGRNARTIHSTVPKMESDTTNVVIVDEVSMLDVGIANWLVEHLGDHTHLILIGDDQQLPSVGPGRVLYDLISGGIPTFRLEQVHRNNGQILDVVYGIRDGKVPEIDNRSDVHFFEVPDAERIPDVVKMLVTTILPAYGCETVKVVAPQKSKDPATGCGWNRLNRDLQAVLNPPGPGKNELRWFGNVLREGDLLLWTENNSEFNLVNGDEVTAEAINFFEIELSNGHSVDLENLTAVHGYACTVHKAQGSEYDAVIFVCHSSHHYMLTRRLAFTACSRAKKMLFIVGERSALDRASRNTRDEGRNTALIDFLNEGSESDSQNSKEL